LELTTDSEERWLRRYARGTRLLFARGALLRCVGVGTHLVLAAVVGPAELGLVAVVRGVLGAAGFLSELGFESAMIRKRDEPTPQEIAAVTGLRFILLVGVLGAVLAFPALLGAAGVLEGRWRGWMLALLVCLLVIPFQTAPRVALERRLAFRELSFVEVSQIVLQNGGLIAAALAGRFMEGLFLAQMVALVYASTALQVLAPGTRVSFRVGTLHSLTRETWGFSLSSLLFVARESITPILIARLFGLDVAGLWALATRIGQLLQLAFEAAWRAGLAGASRLRHSFVHLRRLATESLEISARLGYPATGMLVGCLPLVPLLYPSWGGVVRVAQVYVLALGTFGVVAAALGPVNIALRGSWVAALQQLALTGGIWGGLALVGALGRTNVGEAFAVGYMVYVLTVLLVSVPAVRPPWRHSLARPLAGLAVSFVVYALCASAGLQALYTAGAVSIVSMASALRTAPASSAARGLRRRLRRRNGRWEQSLSRPGLE
jgi:O-antigen/teichoic acid export membrane protein